MENDTVPISQTITVAWHRDDSTEPFDIALVYLKTANGQATATQILTSDVNVTRDDNKIQHGTVTFMATATGEIQMLAIKSDGKHKTETFFTSSIRAEMASTTSRDEGSTSLNSSAASAGSSSTSEVPGLASGASTKPTSVMLNGSESSSSSASMTLISPETPSTAVESPTAPPAEGTDPPKLKDAEKAIIPSVIGGCVVILALVLLWMFLRRRQRRKKNAPSEEFRKEMMALTGVDPMPPGNYHQAEYSRVKGATENDRGVDPTSSTTPLREDFEGDQDNGSSYATSSYSRTSAGTRALSSSGCLGTSTAISDDTSEVPMLPLIPISSNLTLSSPEARAPFRAMTDRQMEIEQKIIELQGRLIATSGPGQDKSRMRAELM
ncbi:hypothetical protein PQX77_015367, partial [Marasmius sp. AFHP31]